MTPEQFDQSIQMLRSADPMTYEDGYHSLQGENLIRYAPQIVGLLQSEVDPDMRARGPLLQRSRREISLAADAAKN